MIRRTYRVVLRAEAVAELEEAASWYDSQRRGLGRDLAHAFRAAITLLRDHPLKHPIVEGEARRVLLRRFPYGVFYEVHGERIVILACLHQARDPDEWRARITAP